MVNSVLFYPINPVKLSNILQNVRRILHEVGDRFS